MFLVQITFPNIIFNNSYLYTMFKKESENMKYFWLFHFQNIFILGFSKTNNDIRAEK